MLIYVDGQAIINLVLVYTFPIRKCQGCHKVVTRLSQDGHKVVALSQGCFKLVTTLYKIPRLSQVLSQGCHKVAKWLEHCHKVATPCMVAVNYHNFNM